MRACPDELAGSYHVSTTRVSTRTKCIYKKGKIGNGPLIAKLAELEG